MSNQLDKILLFDGNQGIYIPQYFAEWVRINSNHPAFVATFFGLEEDDLNDLDSPDNTYYWDAWDTILRHFSMVDSQSQIRYTLCQDDDLWLIPDGYFED